LKNNQLLIFTLEFPFGDSEPFLKAEVEILGESFGKIYLVPLHLDAKRVMQVIPKNVEVLNIAEKLTGEIYRTPGDYFFVFKVFMAEFFSTGNFRILRNYKYHISELFNFVRYAKQLKSVTDAGLIPENDIIYYSYWLDAGASVLAVFKKRYRGKVKVISRAHRFDVYEEISPDGYIFPRKLQLKYIDYLYPISADGLQYLITRYPILKGKAECARLGTKPVEPGQLKKNTDIESKLIVSCSNLIPLKRVHKIIEILSFCRNSITWVHFGGGPLKKELTELSDTLPTNIKVELRGSVENSEVIEFYSNHNVDWFINVSETEGIPVSIMEALSFGIPTIATNVGGNREIVTRETGVLIEKDFDPENVAHLIEESALAEFEKKKIIEFWRVHYNAQTNFTAFAKKISQL